MIYRSRQYWYGNTDPEKTIVRTQLKHIWEGVSQLLYTSMFVNVGNKDID